MKNTLRICSFGVVVAVLGMSIKSFAAPAYGTKMPRKNAFNTGVQTHIVFDRELEDPFGEINSEQYFALLSYGVTDWLSLDLKGGVGNIDQMPGGGGEIHYPKFMGGGYGFRLKLFDDDKTAAVFGFQHISIHPESVKINGVKNKAVLDDWQWSLLASHRVGKITPYAGTKWSRMDYIHWVSDDRKRKQSDFGKSIGLITGVDISLTPETWVNLEGQFFDVEAFAASINVSF
jgi:hypothetical protein